MIDVLAAPDHWRANLDSALRLESLRIVPPWSRYVVLVVNAARNVELSAAAAAICREVSKCRRLVAFEGQTAEDVLPFLGMSGTKIEGGTMRDGPGKIALRILGPSSDLASAFLNTSTAVSTVQQLAEDRDE